MKEIIYQGSQKQRLDKHLAQELTDLSRTKIQKLIKDGLITVNDEKTTAHHWLRLGDKIAINESNVQIIYQFPLEASPPPAENIQIVDETDDYLIINKPAHLIVHPARGVKEKTLVDWLIDKYSDLKGVGENENRPGIVHRLDKEVSGLMVVAKTQKMFEHLKKQFQTHQVTKEYLGLVHGNIDAPEAVIDFPLKRSKLTGKIVAKPKGEAGRDSITEFVVLKRFVNYTYLKINLKTGRSHQIRAHLQAYGYPLVGDKLYKNKKIKEKIKLDRIFLHSHYLKFIDLKNELQEYQSPLPDKLNQILTELK